MKYLSRPLAILLSAIFILTAMPLTASASQDTWDPDNGVYDISTEADLLAFRDALDNESHFEDKTVNVLQDINMTQTYVSPYSNGSKDVQFCGTFNGNNHTISNLNMVSSDNYTVSLLPFLGNATVKDLTLNNVTIDNAYSWNAPFAPLSLGEDKIINCHLEGNCIIQASSSFSRNWNYNAGIVADNYMGSLEVINCSVGENVVINGRGDSGKYRIAGGIVADSRDSTYTLIKNCVNKATITTDYLAGGIMGCLMSSSRSEDKLNYAAIVDCYNYGNISSNIDTTLYHMPCVAGILAESSGFSPITINRCGNFGNISVPVESANPSGGIVGFVGSGSISNCFNAGDITAYDSSSIGGIAGQTRTNTYGSPITGSVDIGEFYFPQQYNNITNCYNVGNIKCLYGKNSQTAVGGVVGICQESNTQVGHSEINNVYNFAAVSNENTDADSKVKIGAVTSETDIMFNNAFAAQGTKAITDLHDYEGHASEYTCKAGYYDNAGIGGKVYPADVVSSPAISGQDVGDAVETISDTPLDTDLKETLDAFVDEVNPEFEQTDGQKFELLQWTYSDGSDGLDVHPVFGYDIINEAEESDKGENGGYLTTSRNGFEYFKFDTEESKTVSVTAVPEAGKSLKSITATDQNGNNVALTDKGNGVYTFEMPKADVTLNAQFEGKSAPKNSVYLTTKDSVDINFLIDADYYTSDPEAYVKLNYNHNPRTYQNDFKDEDVPLKSVEKTEDGRYKFTIKSAPAQLTEPIAITLYDSEGNKLYDANYSMWQYCKDIMDRYISIEQHTSTDMYDEETEEQFKKASELCKSLIDYATAAQVYFNYNKADMASKLVPQEETYYHDDVTNENYYHDVTSLTKEQIKANGAPRASISGSFPVSNTSLMSLSNTEVRFYYEEDINEDDYELSVSCENWYGSARPSAEFGEANSGKYISVGGIESTNLDNLFTLTINNKNTGEVTTIKYNATAYCYTVLRDTEAPQTEKENELRTLVKTIYLYNRYAEDYFTTVNG